MALHIATRKLLLQWPASHGLQADQPYFSLVDQPMGHTIKGAQEVVAKRVNCAKSVAII
jgi:hypothetical protein